jgi:hypothetical protein
MEDVFLMAKEGTARKATKNAEKQTMAPSPQSPPACFATSPTSGEGVNAIRSVEREGSGTQRKGEAVWSYQSCLTNRRF